MFLELEDWEEAMVVVAVLLRGWMLVEAVMPYC